jgi:hypothetical protein
MIAVSPRIATRTFEICGSGGNPVPGRRHPPAVQV